MTRAEWVTLQSAHGSQPGLEPAVVGFDPIVRDVDPNGLAAFARWQDVASQTGFHVLFVQPPELVYEALQSTNLDRVLTAQRS